MSTAAEPPGERARNEDMEPESIVRYPDLWFEDGNIVLVAGNCGFRIHRSILTRKSEVMRDLFSLAQPLGGETFEDCPVVRLMDDSSLLAAFLDILYNRLTCVHCEDCHVPHC